MASPAGNDRRSASLDAYLVSRRAEGYEVETRTAVQAVIVRRRSYLARHLIRTAGAEHRLVVSVDEHGEVSAIAAEPRRW